MSGHLFAPTTKNRSLEERGLELKKQLGGGLLGRVKESEI